MSTVSADAQRKIDAYLAKLRRGLRGVNEQEIHDIVEELRSHILDKAELVGEAISVDHLDQTLRALGSPEKLAADYSTGNLLARAEVSRSPARILSVSFRWASLSIAGLGVFLSSLVGYFLGIAFVLGALLKPLHPQTAGLWRYPDGGTDSTFSLRLGFGSPPPDGNEVLGWWIVPIGLLVGGGLVMLTSRFALGCIRRYRNAQSIPGFAQPE